MLVVTRLAIAGLALLAVAWLAVAGLTLLGIAGLAITGLLEAGLTLLGIAGLLKTRLTLLGIAGLLETRLTLLAIPGPLGTGLTLLVLALLVWLAEARLALLVVPGLGSLLRVLSAGRCEAVLLWFPARVRLLICHGAPLDAASASWLVTGSLPRSPPGPGRRTHEVCWTGVSRVSAYRQKRLQPGLSTN
ncbi:hypothetical protein AVL63_11990 [Nesterenkonia jeotgali]|uniref:Uncharacterized protein n=1 Tax=Nesterenkonia jeotgali TaxID=317018 RepID=A0A0W8IIC5_9MICC|nr:hypothetical protein AVL63_11990 [Nesterenkonia jeotgali]